MGMSWFVIMDITLRYKVIAQYLYPRYIVDDLTRKQSEGLVIQLLPAKVEIKEKSENPAA